MKEISIETIWCCCRKDNNKILIGCIYRPDGEYVSRKADNELNEFLRGILAKGIFSGILIVGDFNYPGIIWQPNQYGIKKKLDHKEKHQAFFQSIENSRLYQNTTGPTFQINDDDTTGNTLDLVFTDTDTRIDEIKVSGPFGGLTRAHKVLRLSFKLDVE